MPGNPLTRCGYVALVSRPNAGKSTLFNALIGQRLSIVSAKPQTTRTRIHGILTTPQSQVIILDTPGILEPDYKLHERMTGQISLAVRDADVVLLLLDAGRPRDRRDLLHKFVRQNRVPLVAALNKVDLLPESEVAEALRSHGEEFGLSTVHPLSALNGTHLEELLETIDSHLPYGEKLYPDDMIAQQPERFFAAEMVREAAFNNLEDELPYSINVVIDEFAERKDLTYVRAVIFVERDSQKGIVIGSGGKRLRTIGKEARAQIEDLLDDKVYLDLWVKVRSDWRNRDKDLEEFGYS
jgi:GTP-binding protein Era